MLDLDWFLYRKHMQYLEAASLKCWSSPFCKRRVISILSFFPFYLPAPRLQAFQVALQFRVCGHGRNSGLGGAGRALQLRGLHGLLNHDHRLHLPGHRSLGVAPAGLAGHPGIPRLRGERGGASVWR